MLNPFTSAEPTAFAARAAGEGGTGGAGGGGSATLIATASVVLLKAAAVCSPPALDGFSMRAAMECFPIIAVHGTDTVSVSPGLILKCLVPTGFSSTINTASPSNGASELL